MLSLVTFRITFTNQITVVQQRLAITTGNTITAASLGLQLVTITGELAPAVDLDWGVGTVHSSYSTAEHTYKLLWIDNSDSLYYFIYSLGRNPCEHGYHHRRHQRDGDVPRQAVD